MHVYMLFGKVLAHYKPKLYVHINTVELHLSGRLLSESPMIRIGLDLPVNVSRILQN